MDVGPNETLVSIDVGLNETLLSIHVGRFGDDDDADHDDDDDDDDVFLMSQRSRATGSGATIHCHETLPSGIRSSLAPHIIIWRSEGLAWGETTLAITAMAAPSLEDFQRAFEELITRTQYCKAPQWALLTSGALPYVWKASQVL